ncbi:MAG: hypothetical protein RIR00_855 [Pseudomonadota bacterium]
MTAADPDTILARITACRACSDYRPATDRCGWCGCSDAMARRAASPLGTCPAGRWPPTAGERPGNTG